MRLRRRHLAAILAATAVVAFVGGAAMSDMRAPEPNETTYNLLPQADGSVNPDPFLASGVGIGKDVATYTASGTGPAATNTLAPEGTPRLYIDYQLLARLRPDFTPSDADKAAGVLPGGMTPTEAQGLNAMARVQENLTSVGLTLRNLTFMRIYVNNPPDSATADYAGWNRAYRKFVANVDLVTGKVIPAYDPVIFENPIRPARSNIEVASLPRAGWLIEIEVVAAYE